MPEVIPPMFNASEKYNVLQQVVQTIIKPFVTLHILINADNCTNILSYLKN